MVWCQWIHILVFFRFTFLYFIICHPITDPSIYLIKSPPLYLEDMGKQVTFAENNLFKTSLYYLRKLTFGKPMIGCAVNIVLWSVLVHIWIVGHKFNKYVFFSHYADKQMEYLQRQSSQTSVASPQNLQAF